MSLSRDQIAAFEKEYGPVPKAVSRLIRPALTADPGKSLVWGDWSAIEARVLPWLSNSEGGERVLDVFRTNDADPALPDIYEIEAGGIYEKDPVEVTKDERQVGKVSCIAAGQLVATDQGETPIEKVRTCARVWDGVSWVRHDGVLYKGFKDVYTYQGLTATADHIVWTDTGLETTLGRCIVNGWRLARGFSPDAVRVVDARRPADEAAQRALVREVPMRRVRYREMGECEQRARSQDQGVPTMLAAACGAEVVGASYVSCEGPLHQPQRPGVASLRGSGYPLPFRDADTSRYMGGEAPRPAEGPRDRQDRQRRTLRAGELKVGDTVATADKPSAVDGCCIIAEAVPSRRMALCPQHSASEATFRDDPSGDHRRCSRCSSDEAKMLAHYSGKAPVYDIANAGPRNRFTVSGVLVHNCLALGFGGGVGALSAMAAGYGLHMDDSFKKFVVDRWRANNQWAVTFWAELMDAFNDARSNPGEPYQAGRVVYVYERDYIGGTMFCFLPDGRPLTYANLRRERVKIEDDVTGEITYEMKLRYQKGYERSTIWKGILAENITQATAASLLRATLVRLENDREFPGETVGHTHDEVITQCDIDDVDGTVQALLDQMNWVPPWAEGLPLVSEASSRWFYSKTKDGKIVK